MDAPRGSRPAADLAAALRASSALPEPEPHAPSLEVAGRDLVADRVYVFENVRDPDGRLWMNLAHEWVREGVRGLFDVPGTTLHPYSPDFTRWIEILGDQRILTDRVARLPESERRVLAAEGTASFVAVPIFLPDGWWGFVAAD